MRQAPITRQSFDFAAEWSSSGEADRHRYVKPEDYGPWDKTGGTDNLATLVAAQEAAQGLWIDGGSMENVLGIVGGWEVEGELRLRNITLKDLSANPRPAEQRMIYANAIGRLYLDHVKFDRNGDGTGGTLSGGGAACVYSVDNADVQIEFCEFTGNDLGNGVYIHRCDQARVLYNRFYDLLYAHDVGNPEHEAVGFEAVQAISLAFCKRVQVIGNDLSHGGRIDQTAVARDIHSRGIVGNQIEGVIANNTVYRWEQGIDITGGNSRHLAITGNVLTYCHTFGIKAANSTTLLSITDNIIHSCGNASVSLNVGADAPNLTSNILVANNMITGSGRSGYWTNVFGITASVGGGTVGATRPRGIIARGNFISSQTGVSTFTVAAVDELTLATPLQWDLGQRVQVSTTGTLPTGLAISTSYWAVPRTDGAFTTVRLASSYINAIDGVVITGFAGGSGTHTMTQMSDMDWGGVVADVNPGPLTFGPPNLWGSDNVVFGALEGESSGWHSTRALGHGTQTITTGAAQDLLVDTINEDTMGAMAVGSADVTCRLTGTYRLDCALEWPTNATSYRALVPHLDTGSGYVADGYGGIVQPPVSTTITVQQASFERRLEVGHKMKFRAGQESGSSLAVGFRLTFNRIVE